MNNEPKHPSEMTSDELEERELGRRYGGGFTDDMPPPPVGEPIETVNELIEEYEIH